MKPLTGAKLKAVQLSFENSELSEQMTGNRYRVKMLAMMDLYGFYIEFRLVEK